MKNLDAVKQQGDLPLPKYNIGNKLFKRNIVGKVVNIITSINFDRETQTISSVDYTYCTISTVGIHDWKEDEVKELK